MAHRAADKAPEVMRGVLVVDIGSLKDQTGGRKCVETDPRCANVVLLLLCLVMAGNRVEFLAAQQRPDPA